MADVRKEKRSGMAYFLTTRRRREVVGCFRHQHCCASIFGEPKSVLFFSSPVVACGRKPVREPEFQNHPQTARGSSAAARCAHHFGATEQNFGAESQVLHRRRSD
jgi:hypothetical protein